MFPRVRVLLFLLVAIIIVATTGCSALTSSGKEEPTPTPIPPPPIPEKPTYTVQRGTVVDSLSFTGRVAPAIEEELFFRTNGRLKKVHVERDDDVQVGDLLGELENDDLVRQLAQVEIELETALLNLEKSQSSGEYAIEKGRISLEISKLKLAKSEDGTKSLDADIQVAQIELSQAKAGPVAEDISIAEREVERAKNSLWSTQLQRDSTCGRSKGVDCDSAQASVQRSADDVSIAELRLQKLLRPMSQEDIALLQADYDAVVQRKVQALLDLEIQRKEIALAELELERLQDNVDPQLSKAVERNKLAVERLKAQVAATRIESPIDGKVTSVSAYDGREVQAYTPVFVIANESEIEITAEPMSSQLDRLAEGMPASIILSSYPGKELLATLTQLPYPYGKGGGATVEEADKATHIDFDPEDLDIEAGDLVKVIVTLEKKENALWLPPAAIRTFAGRQFVVVQDGSQQKRVDVTIGIESLERVEILDGLEDNQMVIGQ